MSVDIHGPFLEEWRITIDGYRVPYISARPLSDGRVDLCIDGRFMLPEPISQDEFNRWLPILANAMAVAAGYSCHGENCQPLNPFKVQMMKLDAPRPTLKSV